MFEKQRGKKRGKGKEEKDNIDHELSRGKERKKKELKSEKGKKKSAKTEGVKKDCPRVEPHRLVE